ncbi:Type-4 uracil-DNA glycosylase [Candidatus Entotheonellaceae bacterium PAL068K]
MQAPAVTGQAVTSKVMLVGQAPGDKEPVMQKPFAWTAGKTLFKWFQEACGIDEQTFRSRVYMAAVCRCFPGKKSKGGDRVPSAEEINNCSRWLQAEMHLLKPELVIPVGKLAIAQFMHYRSMAGHIGRQFRCAYANHRFDVIPLPHPSGASPWPRVEPGKTLLHNALGLIAEHSAWADLFAA